MSWTRRIFVRETLKGWLGLVIAPAGYSIARALLGSRGSEWVEPRDIGAGDGLRPRMSRTVQFGNRRILVTRDGNGQLRAVSAVCTHLGCSIRFESDRAAEELVCNCHESRFSLRGENLCGPATRPLAEYNIETVGGRLILSEMAEDPRRL